MYSYILIVFLGLTLSVVHSLCKDNGTYKRIIEFLFLLILVLVSTFRWETGTDFYSYIYLYDAVPEFGSGSFNDIYQNIEPGFKYLTSITKLFGNVQFYFFTISILSLLPIWVGLIWLNKIIKFNILLALLIYLLVFFLPYNLNAIRQSITMGFFILSLPMIIEKKSLSVLSISILASLFHSTGILIGISYFFIRLFLITKYRTFCYFLLLSLLIYFSNIFVTLFSLFGVDIDRWIDLWGSIDVVSIAVRLFIIGLFIFPRAMDLRVRAQVVLFNLYFYGLFLYISLGSVGMMATRFNMFFRVLEIVIVPFLITKSKFLTNKFFITFIFLFYALFAYYVIGSDPEYLLNLKF
ncbi:EpsG family protein [Vibrio alginolyticus]|uniref:EpsG family protein n=1 Tax=Vibrio alginolyticus TaxID=663 RepID=UPI001BD597FB|nr:EpsG family protein [Vibrio alginolyticus]